MLHMQLCQKIRKKKRSWHPTSTLIARASRGWLHQHTRMGGDPLSTLVAGGSVGRFHLFFSFTFGLNTLLIPVIWQLFFLLSMLSFVSHMVHMLCKKTEIVSSSIFSSKINVWPCYRTVVDVIMRHLSPRCNVRTTSALTWLPIFKKIK
jgi:hypothetical protein